jgi:two-component system phosphate regulon sensor histidine kinase PhoR
MSLERPLLWKLYPTYLAVILICVLGLGLFSLHSTRSRYSEQTIERLRSAATLVRSGLEEYTPDLDSPGTEAWVRTCGRAAEVRVTVILASGRVLADSDEDPSRMENHADRPEVATALSGGTGQAVRRSATLGREMMYLALPVMREDRVTAVVRVAIPLEPVRDAMGAISTQTMLVGLLAVLIATAIAVRVTTALRRQFQEIMDGAERYAGGDFRRKIRPPDTRETARLAEALNRMADQLHGAFAAVVRQKREQEAVLASMVEGVIAVDAEGTLLTLNGAARDMLGVAAPDPKGLSLAEVVRNPDLEALVARIVEGADDVEQSLTLRRGEDRVVRARGTVLRDAESRRIGALVVLQDVTRILRLEAVRRDFVANVSHELKTPITSIHGFAETLRDGALSDPETARRFLDIISRQSRRLQAIIEDLLELSRIERETEAHRVETSVEALRPILEAAVVDCAARAAERGVPVGLACDPGIRARVNPGMLEQAVVNLLDNAIKYTNPGTGVEVRAEVADAAALVHVEDRGPGIPAEHVPRIFERFYRVDRARSRELGGTGLGLAIVKHIVQAHGGSVSVAPRSGGGSVFTLRLPLA